MRAALPALAGLALAHSACSAEPDFDERYAQQQQELDPAARELLLQQMAQILHDDAPYLFLTQDVWIDAAKPNLKGVIVSEVETEQYFDRLYFTE